MKSKIINFWYYNKIYIFIGIAVAGVLIYSFVTAAQARREQEQYDYCIGIVSPEYYGDEQLQALADALSASHGKTDVCCYHFEIGATNQSEIEISSLEADLISNKSSAFLVADPQTFIEVVDVEFTSPVPVSEVPELCGLGFDELSYVSRTDY